MLRQKIHASVSLILIFSIYLGALAPLNMRAYAQKVSGGPARNSTTMNNVNGLDFRLSEGTEGAESRSVTPPAKTDPLSKGEADSLLKRIPQVKTGDEDQKDFAIRDRTLPAPKTGKVNPVKFPSDQDRAVNAPGANNAAKLEVLRFSPSGEVSIAPEMSVTFSQPMVAVTSQEEAAQTVPVKLYPEVKGKWRWLGTKTLMFDAEQRFPQATKFTATIPAGTRSATGGTLDKEVAWTFTTPPPKVTQMVPSTQTTRRDALMYLAFDQEINADLVLSKLEVMSSGKKIPVRFATEAEIAADPSISYYVKQQQPGRWFAFRAVNADGSTANALPPATSITVNVPVGTPSAEGPLTTTVQQPYYFYTYSPLAFIQGYCGWQNNKNCSPFEDWQMQFNNSIDAESFDKSMVRIEPAIEGVNVYPSGNYIYISGGRKKGRTTYTVTIDPRVKDVYGQELGKEAKAVIKVGSAPKALYSQGNNFVVLDPAAKPYYSVYSVNHTALKVKIYSVNPMDWYAFKKYMQRYYEDEAKRPAIPGRLVRDTVIQVKNIADEQVETRIDLAQAMDDGFGNAIVVVEPTVREDKYDRTRITAWTQATQIGLDAFVDAGEMVAMTTALKDGKPISGVELSIYPNKGTALKTRAEVKSSRSWWEWLSNWGSAQSSSPETNGEEVGDATQEEQAAPVQDSARTDDSGILRFALPEQSPDKSNMLIAKKGKDTAFLPESSEYYWQDYGSWYKKAQPDSLRWFVFNDRGIYKPKEEVSIKGWIRKIGGGKFGDVEGLGDIPNGINFVLRDSRGNEVAKGDTTMNMFGGFDFKMKLPDNMNLGNAQLQLTSNSGINGYSHYMPIQIQEFRRPEFEVKAQNETEGPYFVGAGAMVSVDAKYYAGGALQNAETNWSVTATPTNYTPPNRDDYTFGKWFPWWRSFENNYGQTTSQSFKGVTGADGKHRLKMDFLAANPSRPYAVTANAAVQDVNRQTWGASTSLLVHPADIYVGIRTQKTFVQQNERFKVEAIATGIDGEISLNRDITIKAVLKDWVYDKGWKEKIVDEQACSVKSAKDAVNCEFLAKQGGVYTINASVMDDRERKNESELTMWVAGGKTPPKREVTKEEIQLIPSKKEYNPGDVAEILVMTPFTPAEGVLTLRRSGIVKTERFTMNESSKTLRIPIEDKYLPNIYAQVDIVGVTDRTNDLGEVDKTLSKRPALASGTLNLPVSIATRKLSVTAEPEMKTMAPGGETTVNIEVKDSSGRPVANSEAAVVVVDEAVLALTGYRIGDPIWTFYGQRSDDVEDYHLRESIILGNPKDAKTPVIQTQTLSGMATANRAVGGAGRDKDMAMAKPSAAPMKRKAGEKEEAPMQAMDMMASAESSPPPPPPGEPDAPINMRTNFNALAVFSPSVKTDGNGRASVKVKLPDNLTRYRVTAVSVTTDKKFGSGESNITAKQPLMVRPSAPRFMNFGDKVELPVVLQNQTDQPMTVDVVLRATNATITNGNGRRVTVAPNDRAEVRFPVAAEKAGTARFQFAVSSGKFSDAAEVELPVWTPATTEAFATYGTIDENGSIVQPVQAPKDVWPQFGGLEVTTSSTQLQELTDAFIYLYRYRFECSEQISSRMLSIAALKDVLTAFKASEMPKAKDMEAQFAKDIERLKGRQRSNGSFGLWKRDERYRFPFVSAHVTHALIRAREKGYEVPDDMLNRAKAYLKNIEQDYEPLWSNETKWTISAYALYVRSKAGDRDIAKAKNLLKTATLEKLPFEATGWLYGTLSGDKTSETELQAIRLWLNNHTTETAAAANFVTNYKDDGWVIMASNRRADGVILEAMIADQPQSDLIAKLVRGLLAHRKQGSFGNTQENVFILLALDRYFNTYEKVTPDFVAQAWLGNTFAGEQVFKGRSTDFNKFDVPMSYLMEQGGVSNLILNKQGVGRLYYRIGMKYAPHDLKLLPADYGFAVTRQYEAVDDPGDVKQDKDGTWVVKSGARVRVRLQMVATSRRYHVALVDQLPAGLEILNPELATTETIPADSKPATTVTEVGSRSWGYNWWWSRYWFEHQNFRDERAEAFASLLWEGVYNYSYVTRATTPGVFVAPPAKAEEMYTPETFGRTGTDYMRVE